ncbi:MAG: LPP20 family lipoprotein [bacterium]
MRSTVYAVLACALIVMTPIGAIGAGVGPVEQLGQNSWTNWNVGVIKAQGFGIEPRSADSPAQGLIMARRAAVVDAYRNLLEASLDVTVRSKTSVEQAGVKWDTVEAQVEGVIRNATILEERRHPDGRYEIVMQMPMYGQGGLGQVVLPHIMNAPAPGPRPEPMVRPGPRLPQPPSQPGGFTGLVVVVRGVHLDRSMSPAILTPDGQVVYGRGWWRPGEFDADLANRQGIVGYSSSMDGAVRAGGHPLVVNAIGVEGPPMSNFKTDIVISPDDAARIRDANSGGKFLEQLRVDIVLQP